MKRKQGQILTAVLVDYDNIYLALRRKSEEAARRFAKDASGWLKGIESGNLITPTKSVFGSVNRRIVLNRCYGNPVPRRNTHDNSTDMNSFPFIRHHFLRSGFEVVDCPPLTAQLKNSSDIRMVMDVRDFLLHDTYFDEFVILSGDADFTPVLHRLRAHARRTVIFANDHTAVPYKAIADGEIRESDLIQLLINDSQAAEPAIEAERPAARLVDQRQAILDEICGAVRASRHAIPIDLLAERAVKLLGADRTIGTNWAGAGSLRELIRQSAHEGLRIGDQAPYFVFDVNRRVADQSTEPLALTQAAPAPTASSEPAPAAPMATPLPAAALPELRAEPVIEPQIAAQAPGAQLFQQGIGMGFRPLAQMPAAPVNVAPAQQAPVFARPPLPETANPVPTPQPAPAPAPMRSSLGLQLPSFDSFNLSQPIAPQSAPQMRQPVEPQVRQPVEMRSAPPPPLSPPMQTLAPVSQPPPATPRAPDTTTANALQQSIARIHEACQAPPLSPPEYRVLFDVIAREILEKGLAGASTLTNILQRAQDQGVDVRKDDVRFVLEVVSESDPWFEQGASATLFAGRFRNFVVARCRSQGLNLSADELDLIEAWFVAGTPPSKVPQAPPLPMQAQQPAVAPSQSVAHAMQYGQLYAGAPMANAAASQGLADEEFPRIIRTRLRG